jgi:hypothetical protein
MFFKWPSLESNSGSAIIAAIMSMIAAATVGVLSLTDAMGTNSKTRRSVQTSLELNNFETFMKDTLSADLTCGNVLKAATDIPNTFNPYLAVGMRQPLSLKNAGDGGTDWLAAYAGAISPVSLIPPSAAVFQDGVVRDVYLTVVGDVDLMNTNIDRGVVLERIKLANLVVTIENTAVTNGHSLGASIINKNFRLRITSQRPVIGTDGTGPWSMVSCSVTANGNGSNSYTGWTSAPDDCTTVGPSVANTAIGCPVGTYATGVQNVYSGGAVTYLRCCTIRQ